MQSSSEKPQQSDLFLRDISQPHAHQCLTDPDGCPDGRADKICNKERVRVVGRAGSEGSTARGSAAPCLHPQPPLLPAGAACAPSQGIPAPHTTETAARTFSKTLGKGALAGTALIPRPARVPSHESPSPVTPPPPMPLLKSGGRFAAHPRAAAPCPPMLSHRRTPCP